MLSSECSRIEGSNCASLMKWKPSTEASRSRAFRMCCSPTFGCSSLFVLRFTKRRTRAHEHARTRLAPFSLFSCAKWKWKREEESELVRRGFASSSLRCAALRYATLVSLIYWLTRFTITIHFSSFSFSFSFLFPFSLLLFPFLFSSYSLLVSLF